MSDEIVVSSEDAAEVKEAPDAPGAPGGAASSSPGGAASDAPGVSDVPEWLGTTAAARQLGITTRTLYRFIDGGQVTAYRLGRVIRVKRKDVNGFIESCRIEPGTIGHLYPPAASKVASGDEDGVADARLSSVG